VQATQAPERDAQQALTSLWRNRDYTLLWSGQAISTLGSAASGVVFPLLILDLTQSPAVTGIASALAALPYLFFSLPAGALVDRWNRKRVMMLCDTVRALNMASVPLAMIFNLLTVGQLFANAFIEGTMFVFFNTAETAALPRVVARAQLPAANSLNSVADTTAFLVGPSVGTFLYGAVSRTAPFIVDSISYIVSVVSLFFIRTPVQAERVEARRHLLAEIREGISWWWTRPFLRFMAFLNSGLNLSNSPIILIMIVSARALGAPDAAIGVLFSVGAIGGICGALVGPRIQRRFTYGQAVPSIVLYGAIVLPLLGLAPNLLVLGIAAALVFGVGPAYDVVQYSYRLAMIPDNLQGRVNSSFRLVAWGSRPLGAAICGVLLQWVGPGPAGLFFGGIMLVLSMLAFANPHIRNAPPLAEVTAA
jgi:MFS family permease